MAGETILLSIWRYGLNPTCQVSRVVKTTVVICVGLLEMGIDEHVATPVTRHSMSFCSSWPQKVAQYIRGCISCAALKDHLTCRQPS